MKDEKRKINIAMIPTIMLGITVSALGVFFITANIHLLAIGIVCIVAGIIVVFIRGLDGRLSTIALIWVLLIVLCCILGKKGIEEDTMVALCILTFFFPVFATLYCQISDVFKEDRSSVAILEKINAFRDYLEENSVRSSLFVQPTTKEKLFCFANKYFVLKFDLRDFDLLCFKIFVTDKTNGQETVFNIINKNNDYRIDFPAETFNNFFKHIFKKIDYDLTASTLISVISKEIKKFAYIKVKTSTKNNKDLFLDINQASEAELTALPGVTIAKAKRAIKMRKKYAFYLSVNQFYEAINLEEQFIEQITTKGNKILLNELPEYKRIELMEE